MDREWEKAECLLETARHRPYKIRNAFSSPTQYKWKSIHQKLVELYIEECNKEPRHYRLRNASHLLDKLIAREKISCLVVNLYAGNEGYSVLLKGRNGVDTETVRLPYEEAELLHYIDNEELPPVLVDILECSQINIFYSGCVVAEVRDYRRSISPSIYEAHHVLLRPSMQTLICDVNSITNDGTKWTYEDKMALESNLLLATQEPLCLEPSVTVTFVANYLQHSRHKFNITPIKNMAKRYSQTAINRKWKFEQHAAPVNLKLYDFLSRNKDKQRNQLVNLRINKNINEVRKPFEVDLEPPKNVEVENYAKCLPANEISFENTLDLVEKYTLESKQGNGKGYYCQLSIYLRSIDDRFVGHLYTDRDYVEGVMKGATCRFELGNHLDVDRYLKQFIEIFIQESRKTVKITHEVKGQGTTVTSVPGGQVICFPFQNNSTISPLDQYVQQSVLQQSKEMTSPNYPTKIEVAGSSSPSVSSQSGKSQNQSATANSQDTSSTSASLNWRAQQPDSVSTLSLVGIPSGITNLIRNNDQVSKLTTLGVSSGIALPGVALISPSQSSLIAAPTRAVVSSLPNSVCETSLPNATTLTVSNEVSSIMVTSGVPPIPSVINAPASVVSFPVAISGGLGSPNVSARFIASNINSPTIGIQPHRANAVGLLQVSASPIINAGAVSWPSGSSTLSPQTSTPPPTGTTTPPLNIAAVGPSIVNVPTNFNPQQLHVLHQPNNPVPPSSGKSKRKRNTVNSPK